MNSQQRRKDRRLYKYSVFIVSQSYDRYVDMWLWLAERHGRKVNSCGWRDRTFEVTDPDFIDIEYHIEWQFIRQQDAVEFALRWT